MANSYVPFDSYQLINSIAQQMTGRTDLVATDTSSFVSVGQTLLNISTENTLNAISAVIARTIIAIRPYDGSFLTLERTNNEWGAITRKISYLSGEAEPTTYLNTEQNPNRFDDGNSIDMYTIKKAKPIQYNFYNMTTLQDHITRFLKPHIQQAFMNESEFERFWDGVMIEWGNRINVQKEAGRRATVLNMIGAQSALGTTVDLVELYNEEHGTTYTREVLLTTYLTDFMQFVVSTIKTYSDNLTDYSTMYHQNPSDTELIDRHTPKRFQKMIMYKPFFTRARATVFSEIFNPNYLEIGDFEGVNYWQSKTAPSAVNITPDIPDAITGGTKTGAAQSLPYVLGVLYDRDAMGVNYQFDGTSVTPVNSAGRYYNMFYYMNRNNWNDVTENCIVFVLGNGGAAA